jgi:hypothetical protein
MASRKGPEMPRDEVVFDLTSVLADVPRAAIPLEIPQYYAIQRRGARVHLRELVPIQVQFWDAHLVDISRSGALVEHTDRVRPGEVYRLTFPGEIRKMQVLVRAVRSFVSQLVHMAKGEGQVLYRSGMEFVDGGNGVADLVSGSTDQMRQHRPGG